jgi:hypothetical protein
MWNLDDRVRENVPDKSVAINNKNWTLKGIKDWMKKKHEIVEESLVRVTRLCQTTKLDFASYEASNHEDNSNKKTIEKDIPKDNNGV